MVVGFLIFLIGAASAASQADCTQFCTDYQATCAVAGSPIFDIYTDDAACLAECLQWPDDADCLDGVNATLCASGNSYGCRRYHLTVSQANAGNAATHCPHASPASFSTTTVDATANASPVCAATATFTAKGVAPNALLQDFCNQVTKTCGQFAVSSDLATCIALYQFVPGTSVVTAYPPNGNVKYPIPASSGNTLACRRYHTTAGRADATSAATHCPHALLGDGQCGSNCDTYCAIVQGVCTGANAQYTGANAATDCMTACAGFRSDSNYLNYTGNTVQCRLYHLSVASADAASATTHCPHAGAMGGGVCIDAKSAAAGLSASLFVIFGAIFALIL